MHDMNNTKASHLSADGLSRWKDIEHLIPFSRETYRVRAKQGSVPQPIRLGPRISVYKNNEIIQWLSNPNKSI